jgi:hypothetical protein
VELKKPVSRADWKNQALPETVATFTLDLPLSLEELAVVSNGLFPESMEDKWFVYREGNRLFFHRSWTGICVYSVEIEESTNGGRIGEVVVNRDPEQYREIDDSYDALLLRFVVEALLLGKQSSFPLPKTAVDSEHQGLYQHVIAGTGFPEKIVERVEPPVKPLSWWRRVFHR